MKRLLFGTLLVSAGTIPAVEHANADPVEVGPVTQKLMASGPYAVGREELTLEDSSRPTESNKDYKGAPTRTLKTTVWYPAEPRALEGVRPGQAPLAKAAEPFPLVIYSHGFMSFREEGTYLAEHLASHGYMVMAANFPLTNYFAPGGPKLADVAHQPQDVAFLISTALSWNGQKDHPFEGAVDAERIGSVGLSLGGLTSTLVGFHPTLRDPRVKAVVSMAGPSTIFTPTFFQHASVPFMMIGGTLDVIVPYAHHALPIQQQAPQATLVSLVGGTHVNFADVASILFRWHNNPEPVGCFQIERNLPEKLAFHELMGDMSVGLQPMSPESAPCQAKEFPRAIRPDTQHDLTKVAVRMFLEQTLNSAAPARQEATHFLAEVFDGENSTIEVKMPLASASVAQTPVELTPAQVSAPAPEGAPAPASSSP
ncbi:MAG: alpha/beta hydrolase family protein [Myxococcota bacterium]